MKNKKLLIIGIVIVIIIVVLLVLKNNSNTKIKTKINTETEMETENENVYTNVSQIENDTKNYQEVELYKTDLQYNSEKRSYDYELVSLSEEDKIKINEYYNDSTVETEYYDLLFIGVYKLVFADGTVVIMDDNDEYEAQRENNGNKEILQLSEGFKEFIRELCD